MRAFMILLCLAVGPAHAQVFLPRPVEPRIVINGGVNLQAPQVSQRTSPHMEGFPWLGFELGAGASFTVHERWGWAAQFSWARQGYLIGLDTSCFPLFLNNARAELRAWRLLPWEEVLENSTLYAAMGVGLSLQTAGDLDVTEDPFVTTTHYNALTRPYLAPEFGIDRRVNNNRMDFALRYVAHLSDVPAWESACVGPEDRAVFSGKNDHLALVFRFHFGMPPPLPPAPVPVDRTARTTDTLLVLHTTRAAIRIALWDDAEYDGDTISVLVNGEVRVGRLELTTRRRRFLLPLAAGDNLIEVFAHNQGRVPPNTARAVVRTGNGRHQLLLKTGPNRTAAIRVWSGQQ